MSVDLISLAIIALVAAACPILAKLIPGKLIPETVFLLIAGAVLGPNLVGAIELTDSVGLLSDLGLAFLFLLAGYEINPKSLTGSQGKRGLATWAVSIVMAFLFVHFASGLFANEIESVAVAIALTTTALGTLMPILKERELMGTRVGESVLAYGTWGELCPVLAMALLLSTRAEWKTVLILMAFMALCVLVAVVPAKAKKAGHRLFRFLTANAEGTSQTMMRVTVLLLVGLVALSAAFDLDIVLGAFASGCATSSPRATTRSSTSWTAWRTVSSYQSSSWCPARRSTWRPCSSSPRCCWASSRFCCSSARCPSSPHSQPARTRATYRRTTA